MQNVNTAPLHLLWPVVPEIIPAKLNFQRDRNVSPCFRVVKTIDVVFEKMLPKKYIVSEKFHRK